MVRLQYSGLLERFKDVPDPRRRPNRIYPWPFLWALISAAMASACQTPTAIARWITAHRDELFGVLPPTLVRLPCESTIRRTLATVDPCVLDAALTTLGQMESASPPAASEATPTPPLGLAIDGKAVRGVGRDGRPCHLVSLVAHGSGIVLVQAEVARKRDERSVVPHVLHGRDLHGTVLTMDALHTLKTTAPLTRTQGGTT